MTSDSDSGPGSLRQAILQANTNFAPVLIIFRLPQGEHTIRPLSPLPPLSNSIAIDGWTQPGWSGFPVVTLDGALAGTNANGLVISSSFCMVRGLIIYRFSGSGILISDGYADTIRGNMIGSDGTDHHPDYTNGFHGIEVKNSAINVIGGLGPLDGNVISGNGQAGILIDGHTSRGNVILGNKIGTDSRGLRKVLNRYDGIVILDAPKNTIGGTNAAARNLISGSLANGIRITGLGSSNTVVQGNWIGPSATGHANVNGLSDTPNLENGVYVVDAPGTISENLHL